MTPFFLSLFLRLSFPNQVLLFSDFFSPPFLPDFKIVLYYWSMHVHKETGIAPWGESIRFSVHLQIQTSRHGRSVLLSSIFFVSFFFFSKQQCQQAQVNTKCQKNSSSSWHITDCVVFHSSQVKIDTHVFQRLNLFFDSYRTAKEEIVTHSLALAWIHSSMSYFYVWNQSCVSFPSHTKKINAERFPFQWMSVLFSRAQMNQKSMRVENKKHWQHAQA